MNKHTPGPWEVEQPDPKTNYAIDIHSKAANTPGSGWIGSINQQFTSLENGLANARLIAAAPEMYELLKSMLGIGGKEEEAIQELLNRIDNG